jgi:hypothetical protein
MAAHQEASSQQPEALLTLTYQYDIKMITSSNLLVK